jgi:hypothetical protein
MIKALQDYRAVISSSPETNAIMVATLFRKPGVVIETDEATPGTPFRVCTFRVVGRKPGNELVRKVRAALQLAVPGCEVLDLPAADVKEAAKLGMRFRMRYYGQQVPGDRIKDAVARAV